MAHRLRIEYPGALYHVTARGNRRETIYEDDHDRLAFLEVLSQVVDRFNWLCVVSPIRYERVYPF